MNPQTVWHCWRRIMRDTALQNIVLSGSASDAVLANFGLSGEEIQIVQAYGVMADRAKWFVLNYRFRLSNSLVNALDTGAPLLLRALLAKNVDLSALADKFLDAHDWKDYGPFVYSYCLDALDFLIEQPEIAESKSLCALIGLERTAVELMLSLRVCHDMLSPPPGIIVRTPFARYYRSDRALSSWLRDKKSLGRTELAEAPEHFCIYLPDLEHNHKFAILPHRAAEIYEALARPCTREGLATTLARSGYAKHTERDEELLRILAGYHAVSFSRV